MSDLEATFEFSVELYKFYNVDLFQRGMYQVRVGLRVSPKLPVQVEAMVGEIGGSESRGSGGTTQSNGASLIAGMGASKVFQILYRNEEVNLGDIVHFRAHLLVDSKNLKESLNRAEWSLGVELWYGEGVALAPVSCRVLRLHFDPSRGLHYNIPVLFDYFHLSSVSLTVHVALVALHQPFINAPRSNKQWGKLVRSGNSSNTLESVLFGGSSIKCGGGNSSNKIAHARQVHAEVCSILLNSLEGLQNALTLCGSTVPKSLTNNKDSSNSLIGEVSKRINQVSSNKSDSNEEDFTCNAAQDIDRLCTEVTIQWASLLRTVSGKPDAHHALAYIHHSLRVKRFSECFFVLSNPRQTLAGCYDANYQSYQSLSEVTRRSRYLALLPPLPVHCIALDGDPHIMPIIFEDRYEDISEFSRRRIGTFSNLKSGSEPLLCMDAVSDDCSCGVVSLLDSRRPSSEASKVCLSLPKTLSDPQQNVLQATLTLAPHKQKSGSPKKNTIIKQIVKESTFKSRRENVQVTGNSRFIVQNNQIKELQISSTTNNEEHFPKMQDVKANFRHSASTLLDIASDKESGRVKNQKPQASSTNNSFKSNKVSGSSTLPARHSKSLDQLKMSPLLASNNQVPFSYEQPTRSTSKGIIQCSSSYIPQKPTTLPRNMTITNIQSAKNRDFHPEFKSNMQTRSGSHTAAINYNYNDDYNVDFNKLKEQYKNSCALGYNNVNNYNMIGPCMNKQYNGNAFAINGMMNNQMNYPYYMYNNQGNSRHVVENFVYNPLEFQRGYHSTSLPRPAIPPRNSYPPVNNKNQQLNNEQCIPMTAKNIHRSNSTNVFYQKGFPEYAGNIMTYNNFNNGYHCQLPCNHSYNDCSALCQTGSNYSSLHNVDSGIMVNFKDRSSSRSNYESSKSPPSSQSSQSTKKLRKSKSSDQNKLHQSAKELSKLNSSKDSLSSHHSSKSRDSKTDRSSSRSEKYTSSSGKYKASGKMNQQISEPSTSSSQESIPRNVKRLESSASVPYSLDHGPDGLRHSKSAASVLDDSNLNGSILSESLPNLAPPPAFDSPLLDIADKEFKILPPDTFKNEDDHRKEICGSTSSLSEQSGWVSSGRSSERSSPDIANLNKRATKNSFRSSKSSKENTDNLHTNTLQSKHQDNSTPNTKRTALNGEQLRERLLKLALKVAKSQRESLECCCEQPPITSYEFYPCCNAMPLLNTLQKSLKGPSQDILLSNKPSNQFQIANSKPMLGVRHNSFNAVESGGLKSGVFINGIVKDTPIVQTTIGSDGLHPYIRKEVPPKVVKSQSVTSSTVNKQLRERIEYTEKLLEAEIKNLTMDRTQRKLAKQLRLNEVQGSQKAKSDKCKSEVDLSHIDINNFRLPPPQQFRDIPPPPDAFKDPPVVQSLQLDNPLYHVYEGALERRQKRANSITSTSGMTKSQSTGELAKHNSKEDDRDNSIASMVGLAESEQLFMKCREEFKKSIKYPGNLYSDFPPVKASLPYFQIRDELRVFNPKGLHLIVCVHGLDGNSADLRLVKTYLELGLPGAHLNFLMSERNQGDTFSDFDTMTDRLVQEILQYIETLHVEPARISFVGHSLGAILVRSALSRPTLRSLLPKLHTFLSLSGPHLGTLYNSSGLVNAGMWFMQKWKRSGSLLQLSLRDSSDPRQSFLCRLAQKSTLHRFKNVLLIGSSQDRYVPLHSARLELCKAAARDQSVLGQAYREMVHNMISPLIAKGSLTVTRYDAQHALPHTANTLIGRAAHIAALDSDLFIEKFLLVSALPYFQ